MKTKLALATLICFSSCHRTKKASIDQNGETGIAHQIVKPEFQSIIDSADVIGAILLYDYKKDIYYSNNFEWARTGKLPASTFKITNSIIGLETGVIENDSVIFNWDGRPKGNQNWEQDLILRDAFHFSCVPCYQGVARKIGSERMNRYLDTLDYGAMDVDSNTIDTFWLMGSSRISQMQQIDFLKRFYTGVLPISGRTRKIMKKLMIIKETEQYRLSGKSGLSNANEDYNGWFVGYIEGDDTYFFATNIEPKKEFDLDTFISKRMDVTLSAFKRMEIIN
ncbi:penicillin-binding transpeptidase domain-containing protein [Pricia sp.]|uniref:penicillin-binding transpeptidase domain-containing protein n=1 Tax=Pricia sp. TaxID=2268138 RepID=UPI0035946F21